MGRRVDEGRRAEWRDRFRRFERSGLSILRFCAQEGVAVPTFYAWRKRLPDSLTGPRNERPTAFATVRLVGGAPLVAWLPGGTRLELPVHDPAAMELVLRVLMRVDGARARAEADVAGAPSC